MKKLRRAEYLNAGAARFGFVHVLLRPLGEVARPERSQRGPEAGHGGGRGLSANAASVRLT